MGPGASSSHWPWRALGIVREQGVAACIAVPTLARVLDSGNGNEDDSPCPGEFLRGCPVGVKEAPAASLWSSVSRSSGWLVQSQEGVCPLPLGDSPAETAGREMTSQWKDGSWPPGLDQELPFSPLSVGPLSYFLLG